VTSGSGAHRKGEVVMAAAPNPTAWTVSSGADPNYKSRGGGGDGFTRSIQSWGLLGLVSRELANPERDSVITKAVSSRTGHVVRGVEILATFPPAPSWVFVRVYL
jgi:hypothetical protein